MAASSSTAATSNYDVFLSHGVDVKKTFASYLYRRLSSFGWKVFLNQPELQKGDCFAPQIEDAIRSASLHVAIFSAGYADSEWCLNELLLMLDSKAPIIPVFYHVRPTELRWRRGKYGEALDKHARRSRYDPIEIENWRNALSRVAEISGLELDAFNEDEGELLDKLVGVVLSKVKKPALEVAKYPTGLDDKVNDLENTVLLQLQQSGKPQILGIVGLAGVGKTTLAKEIFNRKNPEYSKSCFLENVRYNALDLNLLQRKLLRSLTGLYYPTNSVAEGILEMLREHLSSSKALIVLDDVDDVNQLDALLPIGTVLHSHSLILITSRNKDVLISSRVEESSIYNLTGLERLHSLALFCSHAFNRPYPLPEFEDLTNKFLQICNGWPLSLKVIGTLLYGKEISDWEDELSRLKLMVPYQIQKTIRRSYDSLNIEEQNIFLDIACFFKGENMDKAIRIWNGSGWQGRLGFRNLRSMCLVDVDSKNDIQMHDHLRDIGRDIAEDPSLPTRLWRCTENTMDVLLQQPARTVRGIRMVPDEYNVAVDGIHMGRLQLLDTEHDHVDRILTKVQSPNLVWLRWNNCPYSFLPSSISMRNLRVLEVKGMQLRRLWENDSQAPLELRELQIESPLYSIPNSIGLLKHLKRFAIGLPGMGFPFPSRPQKVPQSLKKSFGNSTNQLSQCQLSRCYALERLSESSGSSTNVRHLQLSTQICPLESLPDSFGKLTNLEHIQLSQCSALERLPESFGNLINLQHIQLSQCSALVILPESIGNLSNLHHIQLYECSALRWLPDSLGNLTNLHHIQLSKCYGLERLPDSFCQLTNLRHLTISDCNNVVEVGTLPHTLIDLSFSDCHNLKRIDQIYRLERLQTLDISGCTELEELPSIETLVSLSKLDAGRCVSLKNIRGLAQLTKLQNLVVKGCSELEELQGIEHSVSLRTLDVSECPKLQLEWGSCCAKEIGSAC